MTQQIKSISHRVIALVSGGKDSCYSMLQCVAAGHKIVGLANLRPTNDDENELDSYMYQTVGHQAIDLYSEAMELPLYRGNLRYFHLNYISYIACVLSLNSLTFFADTLSFYKSL